MSPPQVYELKMEPGEEGYWTDPELRQHVITGGIEQAKDRGCRLLRVLDTEGNQLHLEGFGPRLWDLVRDAHDRIDAELADVRAEARAIHVLLQDAMRAFEAGDIKACHAAIKAAMDKEYDTFGIIEHTGSDELLEALGYDIEQEDR